MKTGTTDCRSCQPSPVAGRLALCLLFAVVLGGCVTPAGARTEGPPSAVLASLRAAERGDVNGFLQGFALDRASEGVSWTDPASDQYAYEMTYRVWLADAAASGALSWHIVQVQPLPRGGELVVADMVASLDESDERFSLQFSTDASGKIVGWTIARVLAGS
jgi:hypothetical protein